MQNIDGAGFFLISCRTPTSQQSCLLLFIEFHWLNNITPKSPMLQHNKEAHMGAILNLVLLLLIMRGGKKKQKKRRRRTYIGKSDWEKMCDDGGKFYG